MGIVAPSDGTRAARAEAACVAASRRQDARSAVQDMYGRHVVYFIRRGIYIKIGTTMNLHRRRQNYGAAWSDALAITPGSFSVEREYHSRFAHARVREQGLGNEHYRITPDLIACINELRVGMKVPALVVEPPDADPIAAAHALLFRRMRLY